jgi:hypothetical protein
MTEIYVYINSNVNVCAKSRLFCMMVADGILNFCLYDVLLIHNKNYYCSFEVLSSREKNFQCHNDKRSISIT